MPLPITALYAAPTLVLVVLLALRVIGYRRLQRVSLGDGGREELQKRIAAHQNLTENAPLFLISLALLEFGGLDALFLHGAGITWLVARLMHPLGIEKRFPSVPLRTFGMGLTLVLHISSAFLLLWFAARAVSGFQAVH